MLLRSNHSLEREVRNEVVARGYLCDIADKVTAQAMQCIEVENDFITNAVDNALIDLKDEIDELNSKIKDAKDCVSYLEDHGVNAYNCDTQVFVVLEGESSDFDLELHEDEIKSRAELYREKQEELEDE